MSTIADFYGAFPAQNRVWKIHVEASQDNVGYVPAEEFRVDPFLPAVGVDPFDPAGAVTIAAGRFVALGHVGGRGSTYYRQSLADTGKTSITLADGKNLVPVGMSINQMYKDTESFMTDSNTAKYKKGFMASVPFILSINNAHGTLQGGDLLTAYWGSTTSTSVQSYNHMGKPVKWNAARMYTTSTTASATVSLSSAIYPGITPTVIASFAAGTLLPSVTASLSFNGTNWIVSYTGTGSATVTEVWYEYGQKADQIAGELMRLRSITDMLNTDNFLKWVEMAPQDYLNFPPMRQAMPRYPVTPVVNETPTTVTAGSRYRTATAPNPISIYHPVVVEVSNATVVGYDGTTSTYASGTWFTLPTNTVLDTRGYFMGLYHSVNWRTGVIDIMSNVTAITSGGALQVRVSYSYQTDPREGAVIWGAGLINLTDGRNVPLANSSASTAQTDWQGNTVYPTPSTTAYGVPAWLNLADVVAEMRIHVR